MAHNKTSVRSLVWRDLKAKLDNGATIEEIKNLSQYGIEAYCLNFRFQYASQLRPYKDGTVNRYIEQFIKNY